MRVWCEVSENIQLHVPPQSVVFWFVVPLLFEISSLASYFLCKNLAIEPPPPPPPHPKPFKFPMTIVDAGMDIFLVVTTGSPDVEYDQYLT